MLLLKELLDLHELRITKGGGDDDGDDTSDEDQNGRKRMKGFNKIFPHLDASKDKKAYSLEQNVGRKVKFKIPKDPKEKKELYRQYGTSVEDDYEIVGVQKDHKGDLVYRIRNTTVNDTFGRAVSSQYLKFVD